jgi:RNA polymerase sigma-70 factor (ECF subfamily)
LTQTPFERTEDLALRARAGDQERFEALVERLAPSLLAWAQLRCRRSGILPEDLVQEVWLRACRIFDGYDAQRSTFRAWLFAVAKNVLREMSAKSRRAWVAPQADTGDARISRLMQSATSVASRAVRTEGVERFVAWVQTLDPKDRMVLIHCGLEGLTHAETGERLSMSKETVAKRWQRLRPDIVERGLPLLED